MSRKKNKISWNVIFWGIHFISMLGFMLPLFLLTPTNQDFKTFGTFHNIISIVEFGVVFFMLGILRTLLNRYISWNKITLQQILKIIFISLIGGLIMQLILYYSLRIINFNFFSNQSIPNMYFGGGKLKLGDSLFKISSWVFGFCTIKMILNYNAFKHKNVMLINKLKQEQINTISGRIDANFMTNSIELIKKIVLTDIEKARQTLTQLSDILRYNLTQEGYEHVTVKDEMEIISSYVSLIREQNKNDLTIEEDFPFELLNMSIKPLKLLNVIQKILDKSSHILVIKILNVEDSFKAHISVNNKRNNGKLTNQNFISDLESLFTKEEDFKLIIADNTISVSFNLLKKNTLIVN